MTKRHRTPLLERSSHDVLGGARSWAEVVSGFRDVRLADDEFVHVVALGSTAPVADVLNEQAATGLKKLTDHDSLVLYAYRRRFGRRLQHEVSGEFLSVECDQAPVALFVYVGRQKFVRFGLDMLLDRMYPRVARPFLAQQELHGLLRSLQRTVQPDALRIQEYTAKGRLRTPARRRFESVRDWTDIDPDAAFREAAERNVWFRSVRFEVVGGKEPGRWTGACGRLSKYGHVTINGALELVDLAIIPSLVRITAESLRLFSNRERVGTPAHEPKPLEVVYEAPLLRRPEDLKRLRDGLTRFPHGSCTVLHANPYFHAALVDNRDFSAVDIWVLSESSILIVPQLHASPAALKRLVNHIFENFGEGRISEPQEA